MRNTVRACLFFVCVLITNERTTYLRPAPGMTPEICLDIDLCADSNSDVTPARVDKPITTGDGGNTSSSCEARRCGCPSILLIFWFFLCILCVWPYQLTKEQRLSSPTGGTCFPRRTCDLLQGGGQCLCVHNQRSKGSGEEGGEEVVVCPKQYKPVISPLLVKVALNLPVLGMQENKRSRKESAEILVQ